MKFWKKMSSHLIQKFLYFSSEISSVQKSPKALLQFFIFPRNMKNSPHTLSSILSRAKAIRDSLFCRY
jgi:hypothetical protein